MIAGLAGWIVQTRDNIGTFTRGFLPAIALAGSAVLSDRRSNLTWVRQA